MEKQPKTLTTKKLYKMPLRELIDLADLYATQIQWLHSTGKTEEPKYKQKCLELYHISEIIDKRQADKKAKPKTNYGK